MLSERRWIKIQDYLTFRPSEVLENKRFMFECKDSQSETGHSLLVKVDATHAGIVTGNRKFYRPDFMQDGVRSWLPSDGTAARPVLRAHDLDGDVLGRVREAKYIDDSWKYANTFPVIKDTVFYNQDAKAGRFNLFKSVTWIRDNLFRQKNYQGLGHIQLGLTMTNPDAIQKVLRDEYLCVSVAAATDQAICSACQTDWASEDKCEHKPGEIVDGHPMFLISGRFKYRELSFINFGADPFAQVKSYELKDRLEKMFFLGLPLDDQQFAVDRGLKLTDSLYESDIELVYEEPKMTFDLAAAEKTLKDANLTAEQAFELQDQLTAWTPEEDSDKTARRNMQSTLTAKIRKQGWKKPAVVEPEVVSDATAAEMAVVEAVADAEVQAAVAEAETVPAAAIADAEAVPAVEAAAEVVDAAAAAAPAAEGGSVISDELTALATGVKLLDAEAKETSEEATAILGHYEALDKAHKAATGDKNGLQYKMEDLHSAIGDRWNKDRYVDWAKSYLKEHVKDSVLTPVAELAEKDEAVLGLTEEVTSLKDKVTAKDASVAAFFTDSKRSLATAIVMHKVLRGKEGFTGLKPAEIQDKISEFSKRHIQSLKDALVDAFTELQWTAAEPGKAGTDQGTTVNDNAQVLESDATDQSVFVHELSLQDSATLENMLRHIHNPNARARLKADVRFGRVKLS